MEKINSLTGMLDLISSKSDQNEFANKIFSTEESLRVIFENFSLLVCSTNLIFKFTFTFRDNNSTFGKRKNDNNDDNISDGPTKKLCA